MVRSLKRSSQGRSRSAAAGVPAGGGGAPAGASWAAGSSVQAAKHSRMQSHAQERPRRPQHCCDAAQQQHLCWAGLVPHCCYHPLLLPPQLPPAGWEWQWGLTAGLAAAPTLSLTAGWCEGVQVLCPLQLQPAQAPQAQSQRAPLRLAAQPAAMRLPRPCCLSRLEPLPPVAVFPPAPRPPGAAPPAAPAPAASCAAAAPPLGALLPLPAVPRCAPHHQALPGQRQLPPGSGSQAARQTPRLRGAVWPRCSPLRRPLPGILAALAHTLHAPLPRPCAAPCARRCCG